MITLIKCISSNKVEIVNWLERYSVEAAIRKKSQANIDVQMTKNSFRALCANQVGEWWDVTQWDQKKFQDSFYKVEKILKGSLDSIPSTSVKTQS